ncbi:MAG: hypothetical protein HFG73_03855 [Hungatella sp.]|nr:hypothetical protein [Hungatella sp.]
MKDERVLAMYDVRGKQEYIYRSRKIKEIIGASAIIRDVFSDYLFPSARKVRNQYKDLGDVEAVYEYDRKTVEAFSSEKFEERMEEGRYIGEVVYDGGGNFLILYRDKETCIRINRLFTKALMEHTYSLKVLCTILENPDFSHYRQDNRRLYGQHRKNEATESVIYPVNSLPVVQTDPLTSRPLSVQRKAVKKEKAEKMSLERAAKYDKYDEEAIRQGEDDGEEILDRIVTERGKESLLAVIYIDGNNMGAQVQACLDGKESYEECVTVLRRFSQEIQKNYVDDRIHAINTKLDNKYNDHLYKKRRTIISAGDEMTIICNARDALDVIKAYFEGMPKECSSCAGIAVFHSHAPYSEAYRLAEECCESGKNWMKEHKMNHACLMDFHYCQGGIGISLEQIRQKELEGKACSRPWLILSHSKDGEKETCCSLELAEELADVLQKLGRSNVKSLLTQALNSPAGLEMELERINAHSTSPLDFTLGGKLKDEEQKRKLLYDMILVYDLWFGHREV